MDNEFNLKNPPIKEVALALSVSGSEFDINFIQKSKNELLKNYPKILPLKAVKIKIDDKNGLKVFTPEDSDAYTLANNEENEIWGIDINKILYIDKRKYSGFDNFLKNFLNQYNVINNEIRKETKIKFISLRYSNEFSFHISELNKNFAILPVFEQQYKGEIYSSTSSYLSIIDIVNAQDKNMRGIANAKFRVDKFDNSKLLINFDIEVSYAADKISMNDEDSLKNNLNKMRLFKNKIFFSNVLRAKEVFDHD